MLVDDALRSRRDDDRPLVEVLASDGSVAYSGSYRQIIAAATTLAGRLPRSARRPVVGVVTANSPEFLVADLALLLGGAVEVPVPLAFSAPQAASMLGGVDLCLVDAAGADRLREWTAAAVLPPGCPVRSVSIVPPAGADPPPDRSPWVDDGDVCKVIHTSGTTSRPKGVRVRAAGLDALLVSLRRVMPRGAYARYLSMVPFSLLVEQVTGIYLVLLDGGTVVLLPADVPLVGTSSFAAESVLPWVRAAAPTAMVATPALAEALAHRAAVAVAAGRSASVDLFGRAEPPLISCGGAPVDVSTLTRLDEHGITVYEGYGLSENSSVVSWNVPGDRRIGTVGRPLDHVRVRRAGDGELLVRGASLFAGYTSTDPSSCAVDADGWLHTGDLAEIEPTGHIRIVGRKKNVIITAAGRNVSPEWVEAQYAALPFVSAAAVVGDGMAGLHGLFVIRPGTSIPRARQRIAEFAADQLSDVERVTVAYVLPSDDDIYREFFTMTGRPRRDAVRHAIEAGALAGIHLPDHRPPSAADPHSAGG